MWRGTEAGVKQGHETADIRCMTGKLARPAAVTAFFLLFFPLWLSAMETEGYASWYGGKFQGRRTANGEIFDTNKLTAAHKSLPFGTKVRVTDLESEKSVIVRINDRGPSWRTG